MIYVKYQCWFCFVFYLTGGTQIQNYESVHTKDHARLDGLVLQQGARIYVTVIAYNAARLSTRLVSQPVPVDVTPPSLCCVTIGDGVNADVRYFTDTAITIHWQVEDPETGIAQCQFSIGNT